MFKQELLLLAYNKDVVCVIDENQLPICQAKASPGRRTNSILPSQDPYIPRAHSVLYNCSELSCSPLKLQSLTQVTSPLLKLKSCSLQTPTEFKCEDIRYNYFKNIDKLLFLRHHIANKTFYAVDCYIYADTGRVCHRKKDDEDHPKDLVEIGNLVRPKEEHILSQDEFLCEETDDLQVNCDLDPYTPYEDGLKVKQTVKAEADILLKSGSYAMLLHKNCIDSWCGFSGSVTPLKKAERRSSQRWPSWVRNSLSGRRYFGYEPPGGKIFHCYYAKRQQVCKMISGLPIYNSRFLPTW